MSVINSLSKQRSHRILTGFTFLISALSIYGIDYLLWNKHFKALKRFKVTGNLNSYLITLFSDPVILFASLLTTSLFILNLIVTWRAIKNSEHAAGLHAIGLLLNMIAFYGILYITMFV